MPPPPRAREAAERRRHAEEARESEARAEAATLAKRERLFEARSRQEEMARRAVQRKQRLAHAAERTPLPPLGTTSPHHRAQAYAARLRSSRSTAHLGGGTGRRLVDSPSTPSLPELSPTGAGATTEGRARGHARPEQPFASPTRTLFIARIDKSGGAAEAARLRGTVLQRIEVPAEAVQELEEDGEVMFKMGKNVVASSGRLRLLGCAGLD